MPPMDGPVMDTAEQVYISSLALLKVKGQWDRRMCVHRIAVCSCALTAYTHARTHTQMLKHGRAGVPMEVMGLMLGEFVDDYTVRVIDVFAMPQSGTVSARTITHNTHTH